jgi:hypothetical protein
MITKYFHFLEYLKEALTEAERERRSAASKAKAEEYIISLYRKDFEFYKKIKIKDRELESNNIPEEEFKEIRKKISDIKSSLLNRSHDLRQAKKAYIQSRKGKSDYSDETTQKYDADIAEVEKEKDEALSRITDPKLLKAIEIDDIVSKEGKSTEEELEKTKQEALNDPFYLRIKRIVEDRKRVDLFDKLIRLFYGDFKEFSLA